MSRATVVLPLPGGPQKIIEPSVGDWSRRVSAPSGPVRCSWPDTSASDVGRRRSASGGGGGSALGLAPSKRLIQPLVPHAAGRLSSRMRRRAGLPAAARMAIAPALPRASETAHDACPSCPTPRPRTSRLSMPGRLERLTRRHGPPGRGQEGARPLDADRAPRQDRLSRNALGAPAPGRTADARKTRSSASIR